MDHAVKSTAGWVAFVLHLEGYPSAVQLAEVENFPMLRDLLNGDGFDLMFSYFGETAHRLSLARPRFSSGHKVRGEVGVTKLLADILPGEHSLGTMCVLAFDPEGVLRSVELYSKAAEVANTG